MGPAGKLAELRDKRSGRPTVAVIRRRLRTGLRSSPGAAVESVGYRLLAGRA